jgi:uncharacterized membrane protein YkvA (DUF1232 family)
MALKLLNKIKSIDVLSPSVKDMLEKSIDKDKIAAKLKDLEADGIEIAEKLAVETQDLQNKVTEFITHKAVDLKQWYSDNQIQDKLEKVAKKVGATVIYPVLLLYNLLNSPNVIVHDKMLIIAPLAYFILPADLIPDVILGAGYVDDGVAIMTALKTFGSSITPEITDQTRKMCKKLIGEVDENVINGVLEKIKQDIEE